MSDRARVGKLLRCAMPAVATVPGRPLRLALERHPTAVLSGRVRGLPMSDDTVFASVTALGADEGSSSTAAIDASHAFRMEDAPAGQVTVTATVKRASVMPRCPRTTVARSKAVAPTSMGRAVCSQRSRLRSELQLTANNPMNNPM